MLRRWLFTLAIVCGLLSAPLAMAGERVGADAGTVAAGHCADMPDGAAADRDHPAPAKQFRCMGACFGVASGIARLPDRVAHRHAAPALPVIPALAGILIDREPPPPRPA